MNPIAKNIIISLIVSIITFGLIHLTHQQLAHLEEGAELITFALIFIAIMVARMLGNQSGTSSNTNSNASNGGATASASDKETGVVKWFNVKKGYGFVTRESGEDIFVHYKNIMGKGKRIINEGQQVRFVVSMGEKGLQADEVETL